MGCCFGLVIIPVMSDMIRRGKAIPVQARRVEAEPQTVHVPGSSSAAGPAGVQPPNVTQNIFYVSVPGAPPQQAAAPASPAAPSGDVHIHNHIHEYPKRRRGGRYGTSFLGTMGFVLAGVACGACYVPQLVWLARFISLAGMGCAALGFLGSLLMGRNGKGMPMLGLLLSGFAYWLWMVKSGQAKLELPKELNFIPTPAQTESMPGAPAPVTPVTPPVLVTPAPATGVNSRARDNTIFSEDPATVGTLTGTVPGTSSTPAVVPVTVKSATDDLENARLMAAKKLGQDYAAVRTAAADAKYEYEQVKQTAPPGSSELMNASRQRMDADASLLKMQAELRKDPGVAAAEGVLKTLRARGR